MRSVECQANDLFLLTSSETDRGLLRRVRGAFKGTRPTLGRGVEKNEISRMGRLTRTGLPLRSATRPRDRAGSERL